MDILGSYQVKIDPSGTVRFLYVPHGETVWLKDPKNVYHLMRGGDVGKKINWELDIFGNYQLMPFR